MIAGSVALNKNEKKLLSQRKHLVDLRKSFMLSSFLSDFDKADSS